MARPAIIIMPIRPCDFLTSDKPLTLGRRCPTTTVNRFSLPRRVPPIIQRVVLRPVRRQLGGGYVRGIDWKRQGRIDGATANRRWSYGVSERESLLSPGKLGAFREHGFVAIIF